jgi:hypothetical protein
LKHAFAILELFDLFFGQAIRGVVYSYNTSLWLSLVFYKLCFIGKSQAATNTLWCQSMPAIQVLPDSIQSEHA